MTDKTSWSEVASKELRGKPLESLTWDTLEGIKVQPLYTAEDVKDLPHMGNVPGQEPYMRGVKATMYAGRPWTIRQYAGGEADGEIVLFLSYAKSAGTVAREAVPDPYYDDRFDEVYDLVNKSSVVATLQH